MYAKKIFFKVVLACFVLLCLFSYKNTYAMNIQSGYGCFHWPDGSQTCDNSFINTFPNNQNGLANSVDTYSIFTQVSYFTLDVFNQSFCPNEDGGTWRGWIWFTDTQASENVTLSVRQGSNRFSCTTEPTGDHYGLAFTCIIPYSFSNSTVSFDIRPKQYQNSNSNRFYLGVGTYTAGTEKCNIGTGAIISNVTENTNRIISNDIANTARIIASQDALKASQDETNRIINDDSVNGANSQGADFFNNFNNNDHGLTGIITAPLRLINSLSNSSCTPLTFPLPFVNQNVTLPCLKAIYQTHFPTFLSLYQLITTGLIAYWVSVKIFQKVKSFKDPNDDKVEVFDL